MEALNCKPTASLQQLTAFLMPAHFSLGVLFYDPKNELSQNPDPAPAATGFQFLNLARSGSTVKSNTTLVLGTRVVCV